MSKVLIVLKREYLNIVKKKSFIISAILTPIFMIGIMFVPALLSRVSVIEERTIAVMDGTGYVYQGLIEAQKRFTMIAKAYEAQAEAAEKAGNTEAADAQMEKEARELGLPGGKIGKFLMEQGAKAAKSFGLINFQKIETDDKGWDSTKDSVLAKIRKETVDVLLVIPADVTPGASVAYYARSSANFEETSLLRKSISDIVVDKRVNDEGMDPVQIKELTTGVGLKAVDVTETGTKKGGFIVNYLMALAFVMLLFAAVTQTGMHLLRGVIEEKSNKIVEILLSSLKPKQLMSGKIIGLGAAGLTLVAIWTVAGLAGLKLTGGMGISISNTAWFYFALFFVLGYLLYSTFMAILGAVMNSEQEAQHFVSIITLLLIVPVFFAPVLIKAPNSTLATVLTMIPLFTPTMIVFRASLMPIPAWQIAAGAGVLIIMIWLMILLTTKIFRVGILMYGKKPSVKEVVKWLKYK